MERTGSGDSAGKDLRTFAGALAKSDGIFIIDMVDLILAEYAYFSLASLNGTERTLLRGGRGVGGRLRGGGLFVFHNISLQ